MTIRLLSVDVGTGVAVRLSSLDTRIVSLVAPNGYVSGPDF